MPENSPEKSEVPSQSARPESSASTSRAGILGRILDRIRPKEQKGVGGLAEALADRFDKWNGSMRQTRELKVALDEAFRKEADEPNEPLNPVQRKVLKAFYQVAKVVHAVPSPNEMMTAVIRDSFRGISDSLRQTNKRQGGPK